jgi:nucleotide-binding universal stress UspA family protein
MLPLPRILLPVDLSDRCIGEARYAVSLAEHFSSEITLLHVLPPHIYFELETVGARKEDRQELLMERTGRARRDIDACLETELHHIPVSRVLEEGDPAAKIVEYAQSGQFGLIMMPTHGYGPFRRLLIGSVTAKVLHDADCPVWTGVHMERGAPVQSAGLNHIVCAVDLGPQSAAVLDWASRMAAEFKAHLSLIHVVVALDPRTEDYYFSPEWRTHLMKCARADVEELQTTVGSHADVHLEVGDVHKAVCGAAGDLKADLLITGRSARSGATGRLPTHTYAIIRDSPCPVVSV